MGLRMGNGISPCFFAFLRGGVGQAITKSLLIFQRKVFAFLFVSFLERMKCIAQLGEPPDGGWTWIQ